MNDVRRSAPVDCHVECVEHKLSLQVVCHTPTDDASAKDVENNCEEQKAGIRWDVRDIRHPKLIGRGRDKAMVNEIRCRPIIVISNRCFIALSPAGADESAFAHQAGYALVADTNTFVAQIALQPLTAVCAMRLLVVRFETIAEENVGLCARRRRMIAPCVIPARGNTEHTA